MSKKDANKFPDTVYVTEDADNADEPFLVTWKDWKETEEGAAVAVYKLVSIKKHKSSHLLE